MSQWTGILLAAGQGSRMKSRIPKVLHEICGKPMILYSVDKLSRLGLERLVVVASDTNVDAIKDLVGDIAEYIIQPEAIGTGDALKTAMTLIDESTQHILVHSADMPLISDDSLDLLVSSHTYYGYDMTLFSSVGVISKDFGRISRSQTGEILKIIESSEAYDSEEGSFEANLGTYCFGRYFLQDALKDLTVRDNGEFYLTDLVEIGALIQSNIGSVNVKSMIECLGVNNRVQLANVESEQRKVILERLMLEGVTIKNPETVYIDANVVIGRDTIILPNTMILGDTKIGELCVIGPGTVITDASIDDNCSVRTSQIENSVIRHNVAIGPYSHIRGGCEIGSRSHIGNFVEMKETKFGPQSASGHFSYLGDADVAANVNIGAGTITCNYDGINKLQTTIGEGAFIGCDTMLVAPVEVGKDASTGAGSVVTSNVPDGRRVFGVPARIRGDQA